MKLSQAEMDFIEQTSGLNLSRKFTLAEFIEASGNVGIAKANEMSEGDSVLKFSLIKFSAIITRDVAENLNARP